MPATAAVQWWVRGTAGDALNGGGFDSSIASAGTNYADDGATPILSLTDLACADSTTVTSVTGGFTAAMIGNCLRIASGTNFVAGYYWITGYSDGNTITVDTKPVTGGTTGSSGVGRVGGSFASLQNLMAGAAGGLANPTIATPLVAGNTIWLEGSGAVDVATADYDYSGTGAGYWSPGKNGTTAAGRIRLIGYNGEPCIKYGGLLCISVQYWSVRGVKFLKNTNTSHLGYGPLGNTGTYCEFTDCRIDVNGTDQNGFLASNIVNCVVYNNGGGAPGTSLAFGHHYYGGTIYGCGAYRVRGHGFANSGDVLVCVNCIAADVGADGYRITGTNYGNSLINCTAYKSGGDACKITHATAAANTCIINCNFDGNGTSANGINVSVGSTALTDRAKMYCNYNNIYNCTSARTNISAGDNDVALDPGFTDAANDNFAVGTAMRGLGIPGAFLTHGGTSYVDLGAVQRPGTASGLGLTAANTRYGVTVDDVTGDLQIPNSGTPTGTQDATSDACVVSGKKYGSPERTGTAAGGGEHSHVFVG